MRQVYEYLQLLGSQSIDLFWFPLLVWSVVAFIAFFALKNAERLNPLYQYHLRMATLAAIPFGFISTYIIHRLSESSLRPDNFGGAIFVVESPFELSISTQTATSVFQPDYLNPNFLIGSVTFLILVISLVLLIRLLTSYISLKKLHRTLETSPLENFQTNGKNIQLAFHDHPLVPFTFGWINPVIVLPKTIQYQPEKVAMAIQHELVHIERGDYLLQLFLSVIESTLWFHPLIRFGAKEIETYREISCDQQVLSTTQVSTKQYASMLYELVPLDRGLSGFSVSMAVRQSTLKQRIETMKHHKLYKSSLKRSVLFFFAMTFLITLPIACSDLQGQQNLDQTEIENEYYTIMTKSISINGVSVQNSATGGVSGSGIGSVYIGTKDNGIFVISLNKVEGAKQTGKISGNSISFTINDLDVEIISSTAILKNNTQAGIWVRHFPEYSAYGTTGLFPKKDIDYEKEFERFKTIDGESAEYYTVVDKLPELVGGLSGLKRNISYPEEAKRQGIQGRVTVQFIVTEKGKVENPKIVQGIGSGCDEAALEAVKLAEFTPGIQDGKPVRVQYSLPIIFRLTDKD